VATHPFSKQTTDEVWAILRLVLVLIAALAVNPAAGAWTWPSGGFVLRPVLFDRAQPLCGRATPWHRCWRRRRRHGTRPRRGVDQLRRHGARQRAVGDDRDGRRLVGDAHPPRLHHDQSGRDCRRRRRRRDDWVERGARARRAVRASGDPAVVGPGRLRRSGEPAADNAGAWLTGRCRARHGRSRSAGRRRPGRDAGHLERSGRRRRRSSCARRRSNDRPGGGAFTARGCGDRSRYPTAGATSAHAERERVAGDAACGRTRGLDGSHRAARARGAGRRDTCGAQSRATLRARGSRIRFPAIATLADRRRSPRAGDGRGAVGSGVGSSAA
jgi:hypothetical protein